MSLFLFLFMYIEFRLEILLHDKLSVPTKFFEFTCLSARFSNEIHHTKSRLVNTKFSMPANPVPNTELTSESKT
jgi:hypothetical protein